MRIRRTISALLTAVLACAMLLSACGGGSNDESAKGGIEQTSESGYPAGGLPGPEDTAYPGP